MEETVTFGRAGRSARFVALCLGAALAAAASVATLLVADARPPGPVAKLLLIYVGADDCAPCRVWQRGDGAAFQKSSDFARLSYVEVKSPRLYDLLRDENWPEQIRGYRERLKRSDGVPLWLVVANDQVVEQGFGEAAWRDSILPAIRSAVR